LAVHDDVLADRKRTKLAPELVPLAADKRVLGEKRESGGSVSTRRSAVSMLL
jgi:hypothetical protein